MDKKSLQDDQALIAKLGGPTALAKLLGPGYGKQRVHNWLKRGIPAAVKLKHSSIFLVKTHGD